MLTESERHVILAGWATVTSDKRQLGMEIFLKMFELHPQYQDMFHHFKGKSREELVDHPRLKAHGMRMVNTLEAAIQNLDDMEVCAHSFEMIGATHKRHGLTVQHFEDLNQVLADVLQQKLGTSFSENRPVWEKFFHSVLPAIEHGL